MQLIYNTTELTPNRAYKASNKLFLFAELIKKSNGYKYNQIKIYKNIKMKKRQIIEIKLQLI